MTEVVDKAKKAQKASHIMAEASTLQKNEALENIAQLLGNKAESIIQENSLDLDRLMEKEGYTKAFYDRLQLTTERIKDMAEGLRAIIALPDPVGEVTSMWRRPNGLQVGQVRVPLGVIGIIYEARPNVTIDAASLGLKSGNAVVLRGSSEAINSNKALVEILREGLKQADLPEDAVLLIEDVSRSAATELMQQNQYLDVLVPRGGAALIKTVVENATVPVLETGIGNCHTYVDSNADLNMALEIADNAKTHRPGVCNAMETLLVHQEIAASFLPQIIKRLEEKGVECRGCQITQKYVNSVKPAVEEDWKTEYLDLILAIKVVENFEEAIDHINTYGSGHSEAIVTSDYARGHAFLSRVNAAAVYINASTRFTDGFEFGLGAEMGISTQKLHARGPMGLTALTSTKYIIFGDGQIR